MTSAYQKAQQLIAGGNTESAVTLLSENRHEQQSAVRLREMLIGERRDEQATAVILGLAGGSGPEALVSQSIMAFRQGDLDVAVALAQQALDADPSLATAFNHLGRALHNAGQLPQALQAFQQATRAQDDYPEAWHNLGHAQRANGDLESAVQSFQRALELAPGFRVAIHNLGATLFHLDQVQAAHDCFQALLESDPLDVEALLGAGLCLQLFGRYDEALALFRRAVARDSGNAVAQLYLGTLLNELMDTEAALEALQRSVELDPFDVEAWVELGGIHEQNNRLDDATEALLMGFKVDANHPGLNLETAKVERQRGHAASAVRRLQKLDPTTLTPRQAQQVGFELGLALDREGRADEAIAAFIEGNRLARNSVRSQAMDPDALERRLAKLTQWLDTGAYGARRRLEDPLVDTGRDLCFLVGFPRSGTTLIDTTLETSPDVMALEEAATLDFVIAELENRPGGYPMALDQTAASDLKHFQRIYRQALDDHLEGARPALVVDKMPLRFMHAGLIGRMFPDARMLFVLRHPCDVVLSNFMQQYAVNETNIHFDTLEHCAVTYDHIMQLWQQMEPLLELPLDYVRYEDLVGDTENTIGRVCEFLGVNNDRVSLDRQARLDTRDRVKTSSYQQVAEPIYQRAAGRWHSYRQHLEPFLPLLHPHIERYGYSE